MAAFTPVPGYSHCTHLALDAIVGSADYESAISPEHHAELEAMPPDNWTYAQRWNRNLSSYYLKDLVRVEAGAAADLCAPHAPTSLLEEDPRESQSSICSHAQANAFHCKLCGFNVPPGNTRAHEPFLNCRTLPVCCVLCPGSGVLANR